MISKVKYEYLLGFIAIVWILFFPYVLQLSCNYTVEGDEGSYLFAAKKLYLNLKIDDGRPLLISAINGFPLLLGFSEHSIFKWILFVNLLCWFSTIILIYKISIKNTDKKFGFLLSLIFVFCIGNLAITYELLSESVFILMLILSIFFINKYLITNNNTYLTLTTALLLLAILVKPLSIGLVFIFIFLFMRKIKKIFFNKFSFLILFSLSLIFIQMYSLKREYGNFTVSYIDSFTYYNYLGTRAQNLKNNIEFSQGNSKRYADFAKASSSQQRKIANEDLKNQLKTNPINLLKAYFINLYINSSKGSATVHGSKNISKSNYFYNFQLVFKAISKLQNIIFTIVGIPLSILCIISFRKQKIFFNILSLIILYVFFVSGISSDQGDRFHIVLYPLIILLLLNTKWFKSKPLCIE